MTATGSFMSDAGIPNRSRLVIDAGEAVIGPGFVDLDALFDLDTTVLGFDNHPGWKKGRVWAADYVANGPRDVYTPDEETFQHEYAIAQLLLHGITTALPIRSILYREWAETYEENARAAESAERLGIRLYLGPSYRTGLPMVDDYGAIRMHWDADRGMAGLARSDPVCRGLRWNGQRPYPWLSPTRPDRRLHRRTADRHRASRSRPRLSSPVALLPGSPRTRDRSGTVGQDGRCRCSMTSDFSISVTASPAWQSRSEGREPTPATIEHDLGLLAGSGQRSSTARWLSLATATSSVRFRPTGIVASHIGLGTDTFPPDMFLNMHLGTMASRIAEGSMRTTAADLYTAATIGGADALRRPDLGRLELGALADIVVFDLTSPSLGQIFDPIQTMVLSGSGRDVRMVIVDGRIVVEDGILPGVDMEAWHRRANKSFQKQVESTPGTGARPSPCRRSLSAIVSFKVEP